MTDSTISGLTSATTMTSDDLLVMVDDPSGTPITKKITRANFMGGTTIIQVVGTDETQTLTNKTLTSPIMTTPTLGVASATSLNKITFTTPATGSTVTIIDGKTVTFNKTLTFDGTDSTTLTFPSTTDTIVGRASTDTLTNKTIVTQIVSEGLTASGSTSNDFSGSTGTFKTSTGAATFGGASNTFTNAITPTGGVAAAAGFSAAARTIHTGGLAASSTTYGTDTTPATTETYICEVFVPSNMTITGVAVLNGSANAGNIQLSLADSTGAPIAAALTASTAASGTSAFQRVPFAVAYAAKGPATYYVLLQNNNTGNRFRSHNVGNFGASKKTGETYGTFTSVTPATTFTTGQGAVASLY